VFSLIVFLAGCIWGAFLYAVYQCDPRYNTKEGTPSASHNSVRNAIPASEAYCRKHAGSKTMSWQRAFLDGVAWRERHP